MREHVLVIENDLLSPYIRSDNGLLLTHGTEPIFRAILENHTFIERETAEQDYKRKQVIPYVIIRHDDSYLLLKRTEQQAEKRLHNKYSLGIGGHINPAETISDENIILGGLYRELAEEISIQQAGPPRFIGIINDDSNSVSRVHLGLLYEIETSSQNFEVLETDKMTARWARTDELPDYYGEFETWSQIVYDRYINRVNIVESNN
jgi:predicted NUDIX family phosphoesterase